MEAVFKILESIDAMSKVGEKRISLSLKWIVLTLIDRLILLLLWVYVGIVTLVALLTSISTKDALWLSVPLLIFSLVIHVFHEFISTIQEFPYWRSVERRCLDRCLTTLPLIVSTIIIACALFYHDDITAAISIFIVISSLDFYIGVTSAQLSDCYYPYFCSSFMVNSNKTSDNNDLHCQKNVLLDGETFNVSTDFSNMDCENKGSKNDDFLTLSTQTRIRSLLGDTRVFGQCVIEFEKNSEVAQAYISFCPPFKRKPKFEFEQITDEDIKIKATAIQPYGVRIEARRFINSVLNADAQKSICSLEYYASDEIDSNE